MISQEEIDRFLQGNDPEQYIVSVEYDFVEDCIYKIKEIPGKGKVLQKDTLIAFAWVGDLRGLNFYENSKKPITKEKIEYFNILKSEFKEKYVNKDFFTISYEELYYNNGFEKIVNYLNIDEVRNTGFPIGNKYRINKTKTLI